MKPTRILLLGVFLLGAVASAGSAATSIAAGIHIGPSGHARVDLGFFYDDLAPYGHWVERPHYGWVWTPRVAVTTWRPYTHGHWAWTDWGWTWISDEPFGWATYHYGRWYDDPDYGWEWVPGNEWAPAYVSWQEGSDYVGWAPLPPAVDIRAGRFDVAIEPDDYVFVPERRFLEPRIVDYAVPVYEDPGIYQRTRNCTSYRFSGNRIFDQGVPIDNVRRAIGRPVPQYQVADLGWNQRHQGARFARNQVAMFRPQVEQARVAPPPNRPLARRALMTAATAATTVKAVHAFRAQRQARMAAAGQLPRQQQIQQQRQPRWQRQQQAQQQVQQQRQPRWQRQQLAQQRAQQQKNMRQPRWQRQQQAQQQVQQQRQPRWQRQQLAQQQARQQKDVRQPRWQRQQQAQQQVRQQRQPRWQRQQLAQQQAQQQRQPRWQRQQQAQQQIRQQRQPRWQQQAQQQPPPQRQPRWQRQQQQAQQQPQPQRQPRWQRQQQAAQQPQGNPHRRRQNGGPGP